MPPEEQDASDLSWGPWDKGREEAKEALPASDGFTYESWLGEPDLDPEHEAPLAPRADEIPPAASASPTTPMGNTVVLGPEDTMPDIEDDIRNQPLGARQPYEAAASAQPGQQPAAWKEISSETEQEPLHPLDSPQEASWNGRPAAEAAEIPPPFTPIQLDSLSQNIETALAMAEEQIEEIREMARAIEAERDALRAKLEQALSDLAEARVRREEAMSIRRGMSGDSTGLAHEEASVSSGAFDEPAGRPELISEEESKGLSAMLESFMRFTNSD